MVIGRDTMILSFDVFFKSTHRHAECDFNDTFLGQHRQAELVSLIHALRRVESDWFGFKAEPIMSSVSIHAPRRVRLRMEIRSEA